ncbi:MAG: hypothetical protein HYR97_03655 [Candidatus Melainabacteria bacterium]|nr:hypothetical protein [Candidatus Melainabacteria bacterium]
MRPERITSYTDLRGREIHDLRGLPSDQASQLPPETSVSATESKSPAETATQLRQATVFKRNYSRLFILPEKYNYEMFEGSGELDSKGNPVVLVVGPFGGGKNSLVDAAAKVANHIARQVVEHTSRERRPHETEGKEYYFVTLDEFQRMAHDNELLVWGDLTGNYYGYAIKPIQDALDSKKVPILVQGPNNVGPLKNALEARNIPTITTFVSPLSKEELSQEGGIDKALAILEKRMEGTQRNRLQERQEINRAMFESLPDCVHVIDNSNGNLEQATVDFLSLIQAKKDELSAQRITDKFGDAHPALALFKQTGQISDVYLKDIKLDPKGSFAIIVCGPSGAGKSTILKQAFQDTSLKLEKVITNTTRDSRPGEKDGVDYNFLSNGEFEEKIESKDLLEWLQVVNADFYGSSSSTIQGIFNSGQVPVFDLDPEGSNYYRYIFDKLGIPYVDVFVSPISKEELQNPTNFEKGKDILRERIKNRGSGESPEKVEGRVQKADKYFKAAHTFTHVLHSVDGDIEGSVKNLKGLVYAKKEELIAKRIEEKYGEKHPSLIEFEQTGQISDDFLVKHKLDSKGQIAIILSGPSGVGKGTILEDAFSDSNLRLGKALTSTTRAQRPSETDGVEYTFITIDDFEKMLENNEFFEWLTIVSGKYYAYSQSQIQGIFDAKKDAVFDVVPSVASFLKHAFDKTGVPYVDVFISPVVKDVLLSKDGLEKALPILEERIRNRGSGESEAQIQDRLKMTREFLKAAPTFTHIIENTAGRLPESIDNFKALIALKKQGAF